MTIDRDRKYQEMAVRSKYRKLHAYLCSLSTPEWKTSFDEIESSILEFELPASARLHRPWWSNQKSGNGHSQALAWTVAGWETAEVDMESPDAVAQKEAIGGRAQIQPRRGMACPHCGGVAGKSESPP